MSFATSALVEPTRGILRQGLLTGAKYLGVVAGAVVVGAGYQLAQDEGRQLVHSFRMKAHNRHLRNERLSLLLFNTALPLLLQERLSRARDVHRACMRIITDETLPDDQRRMLRAVLQHLEGLERDTE